MFLGVKFILMCAISGYFIANERLFKPLRECVTKKNKEAGRFLSCEKCVTFWFTAISIIPCYYFPLIVVFLYPVVMAAFIAGLIGLIFEKLK
jgi:hypothetical protein